MEFLDHSGRGHLAGDRRPFVGLRHSLRFCAGRAVVGPDLGGAALAAANEDRRFLLFRPLPGDVALRQPYRPAQHQQGRGGFLLAGHGGAAAALSFRGLFPQCFCVGRGFHLFASGWPASWRAAGLSAFFLRLFFGERARAGLNSA